MTTPQPRITVNGRPIPPEAIEFELGRLVKFYCQHMPEEQVRAQLPALRERAIEQAIGARLLFDEATRLDLAVPEAEVDERLAAMKRQTGGEEKFERLCGNAHRRRLLRPAFAGGREPVDERLEALDLPLHDRAALAPEIRLP